MPKKKVSEPLPALTKDNYYNHEIRSKYMTVHTYQDYMGTLGRIGCEARAEAMRKGEWSEDTTEAMLIGSYVDSWFEGTLDEFATEHPEIFLKDGKTLKAGFRIADKMIERAKQDELFMKYMSGEKQKIFTADMFGCTWCGKLDSYIPGKAIVDLKTTSDLHRMWRVGANESVTVVEYWGYEQQLAIYQELVRINTGEKLPCYLAFVTKEEFPELAIVHITQDLLDAALNDIKENMPQVLAVRNGEYEPCRCERCNYCKSTAKCGVTDIYGLVGG